MESKFNFNMSTQSLLVILIILLVIQTVGVFVCKEGVSAGKQRFASERSGIASLVEGYGLSGADYNGQHLNFHSSKGEGNVVSSSRPLETMPEMTEGLNLIKDQY